MVEIIGYIATILTTCATFPQFIKSVKSKSVGDISIWYLFPLSLGLMFWLAYGIMLGSIPMIIANTIGVFTMGWITILKLRSNDEN